MFKPFRRKTLPLFCVFLLLFGLLAACGNEPAPTEEPEETEEQRLLKNNYYAVYKDETLLKYCQVKDNKMLFTETDGTQGAEYRLTYSKKDDEYAIKDSSGSHSFIVTESNGELRLRFDDGETWNLTRVSRKEIPEPTAAPPVQSTEANAVQATTAAPLQPAVPETWTPVPATQQPTMPETQQPAVPETQQPAVPETQQPAVPETFTPVLETTAVPVLETYMSLGGASAGGSMYTVAAALASSFSNSIPGMNVSPRTSTGSVENALLVNNGDFELGICAGDSALAAINGTGWFEEQGRQEYLCAIGAVYPYLSSWLALRSSGFRYLHDANGGSFGVGPAGSITETVSMIALEAAGISGGLNYTTLGDAVEFVLEGRFTAAHAFGGSPVSTQKNASDRADCVWLGYMEEELERIVAENPAYYKTEIPAGTYRGQDEAVPTFGMKCLLICSTRLDYDTAYQLAKTMYEQAQEIAEYGDFLNSIKDPFFVAAELPIPLHPGAEAFYREMHLLP